MSEPTAKSDSASVTSSGPAANAGTAGPAGESGGAAAKAATAPDVAPPRALLLDAGLALLVVAFCYWKRSVFLDLSDSWVLALSLLVPGLNLGALVCSLRGRKLSEAALHYRMALGAILTLYYVYLGLHLVGWYESPLGAVLTYAAGSAARLETGAILLALIGQNLYAADACQKTLAALHPAPESPAAPAAPAASPPSDEARAAARRIADAPTIIPV